MSRIALVLLPLFLAQAGGCQNPDRFAAWPLEDEPKQVADKGGPWIELDFADYADTAELEAVPGIRLSGLQTHELSRGVTPSGGDALRLNFPVALSNPDMGAGLEIIPPDGDQVRAREIWIEVWARFSEHWTTGGVEKWDGMEHYTGSHKFLLMQEAGYVNRWEDFHGVYGSPTREGDRNIMVNGGTLGIGERAMTEEWDGEWHRYRYHARMDPVNGRWMMEQDGTSTLGFEGVPLGNSTSSYFIWFQFGANNNRGTDGVNDMWYEIADIRFHSTDPGWVLP